MTTELADTDGSGSQTDATRRWSLLFAGTTVLALALACGWHLREGDIFWHISDGLRILKTHTIPRVDEFSWTAAGKPWHPNAWGFDTLSARVWQLGGFPAVGRLVILVAAATFTALLVRARTFGAGLVAASLALVLGTPVLLGAITARPQIFSYLFFVLLLLTLDRALNASGSTRIWWWVTIELGQVVWINTHGFGLFAFAVVGAYVAGWQLEQRMTGRTRTPGAFAGAAVWSLPAGLLAAAGVAAVSCLNPRGVAVFSDALHTRATSIGVIVEWSPIWTNLSWLLALLLVAAPTVLAFRQGRYRQVAAMIVVVTSAASAARFLPLALLLGHAEVALVFGMIWRWPPLRDWRISVAALAACMLPLLLPATIGGTLSPGSLLANDAPLAAVRAIPTGCRLYNEFTAGGLIILERWPDVKVSMDGRNDMYGRKLVLDNVRTFSAATGWASLSELYQNKVTCVLAYSSRPLNSLLASEPAWHVVFQDHHATVWARTLSHS